MVFLQKTQSLLRDNNTDLDLSMSGGDEEFYTESPDAREGLAAKEAAVVEVASLEDEWKIAPENPHNWSMGKKIYNTAVPAVFSFIVTFGSSVITPATSLIEQDFHVSRTAAILSLSLYVLGLACGPMISAPISESLGRRVVYLTAFPVSLFFTLGAGYSHNFGSLLVLRFLAGMFGSPALAVGAGTNLDIWNRLHFAVAGAVYLAAPFLGPGLGPAVGGYASMRKGWRWTQWPILFIGLASYLLSLFCSETYKKILIRKVATRTGLPQPAAPKLSGLAKLRMVLLITLLRPLRMLALEPIITLLSLYTAFNFSVLFAFFAAFPIVFEGVYGFNTGEGGIVFLGIGIGVALATLIYLIIDRITYRKWTLAAQAKGDHASLAPEDRLYGGMVGSLLLPISLFWFAWTAKKDVHWIVPVIATIPFGTGNLLVFCSSTFYLLDTYGPVYGASAMAANGLLRYIAGAVFPLFTFQMYGKLGIDWATSLLGFVTVALLPIPWVLYRWGEKIRGKSEYRT